jgi:hypothetical protein
MKDWRSSSGAPSRERQSQITGVFDPANIEFKTGPIANLRFVEIGPAYDQATAARRLAVLQTKEELRNGKRSAKTHTTTKQSGLDPEQRLSVGTF